MKTLRYISLVVLLAGCSAILIASSRQRDVIHPAKGARIVYTQTITSNGESRLAGIRHRLITDSGEWKEVHSRLRSDGSVVALNDYSNKSGQFALTPKTEGLAVTGPAAPLSSQFRSTKFLRNHKEFVGEGALLGYKTYILRVDTGGGFIEQHFAPEVAALPVKVIRHQPNFETVIEAVSIEFIDVTPDMIATPDLPINTQHLIKQAEKMEASGQKDAAARIRAFAASKEQK